MGSLVGVKPLFLALLLAAPCIAEWPRLVITQKDTWVDASAPHALSYFTDYPALRDEGGAFCYSCTPEKKLAEAKKVTAKAKVQVIGTLNGFTAYDVFYYFEDEQKPAWKSIIIQTGPDSYREIYHDQPNEGQPTESFIVNAENESLVCVLENVYKWDAEDDCFWVAPDGVVRIDFGSAWKAAQSAVPAGRMIWEYGIKARTTFKTMVLAVGLRYEDTGRCCDDGVVNVRFRLDRGRTIVMGADFDPGADPADPW